MDLKKQISEIAGFVSLAVNVVLFIILIAILFSNNPYSPQVKNLPIEVPDEQNVIFEFYLGLDRINIHEDQQTFDRKEVFYWRQFLEMPEEERDEKK